MLERFRDRAAAVRAPAAAAGRGRGAQRFIEQAQLDFQDFAIVGDATWTFDDGVLTLTVDLRPETARSEVPDLLVGALVEVEPLQERAIDRDPDRLRERVDDDRAEHHDRQRRSRAAARPGCRAP